MLALNLNHLYNHGV